MTRYLTVDEILRLHALEVGAEVGLRDRNLFEAAAERPQQSVSSVVQVPEPQCPLRGGLHNGTER